jgi:plastocyanin
MRKLVLMVALGALSSLALVACGGGGSSSSSTPAASGSSTTSTTPATGGGGGGGSTVKVEADPSGNLAYTQTSLTANAGSDTIDFDNASSTPHNVTIQDSSGKTIGATDTITGSTASTTVDLKAGTYTFFCSVDSHEQAGMKGTLTVK